MIKPLRTKLEGFLCVDLNQKEIWRQRGAADYGHVQPRAGGEPLHLRWEWRNCRFSREEM